MNEAVRPGVLANIAPGAAGAAQRPQAEQEQGGAPPRPLIVPSTPEEVAEQAGNIEENIQQFFYGENSDPNFERIEQQLSSTQGQQQIEMIGTLSEDLLREIYRNAILNGHKIDKAAMLDGLASAVNEHFEIAENIGAMPELDEKAEQEQQMLSIMVAGKRLFVENPPEGLESSIEEIQEFMNDVSSGAYDEPAASQNITDTEAPNGGNS